MRLQLTCGVPRATSKPLCPSEGFPNGSEDRLNLERYECFDMKDMELNTIEGSEAFPRTSAAEVSKEVE